MAKMMIPKNQKLVTVTCIQILHWCTKCGTVWTGVVLRALHSEAMVQFLVLVMIWSLIVSRHNIQRIVKTNQ